MVMDDVGKGHEHEHYGLLALRQRPLEMASARSERAFADGKIRAHARERRQTARRREPEGDRSS